MVATPRPTPTGAVALLADIPGTGYLGAVRADRFALRGGDPDERFAPFLAFASRQIDAGRKVVALYPRWRPEPAVRAIRFARGGLGTDHIAAVGLNLAPLPLSLVADQLAYLAPHLPPGLLAALCDELPRRILAGAWLTGAGGLRGLPTSPGQHLVSYVPGTAFLACCAPTRQVHRISGRTIDLPYRPDAPVRVLSSAAADAEAAAFSRHIAPLLAPAGSRSVPVQPLSRQYWRSPSYVEFTAFSAHPDALPSAVDAISAGVCTWCREPVAGRRCPFCEAVNAVPTPPRPTPRAVPASRPDPAPVSPLASRAASPPTAAEFVRSLPRSEPVPPFPDEDPGRPLPGAEPAPPLPEPGHGPLPPAETPAEMVPVQRLPPAESEPPAPPGASAPVPGPSGIGRHPSEPPASLPMAPNGRRGGTRGHRVSDCGRNPHLK